MRDLPVREMLGDNTDDPPAIVQNGVSQHTHQANTRTAVDKGTSTRDERVTQVTRRRPVAVERAGACAGENANTFHWAPPSRWTTAVGTRTTIRVFRTGDRDVGDRATVPRRGGPPGDGLLS
jgi:hypothetical protein